VTCRGLHEVYVGISKTELVDFVSATAQKAGEAMSKRHDHRTTVFPPKVELRAHAHNERHRVHSELHNVVNMVSHGVEPEDVIEPGIAWKGMHHHDAEIGREQARRREFKHWKTKAWKRRKVTRKQRAIEIQHLREIA
jgi:hypothetical protein